MAAGSCTSKGKIVGIFWDGDFQWELTLAMTK